MKNNTMKRVLAGTLAVLTVAAYVPANVGGLIQVGDSIVANAATAVKASWNDNVGQYITSITDGTTTINSDNIKNVDGYKFLENTVLTITSSIPLEFTKTGIANFTKVDDDAVATTDLAAKEGENYTNEDKYIETVSNGVYTYKILNNKQLAINGVIINVEVKNADNTILQLGDGNQVTLTALDGECIYTDLDATNAQAQVYKKGKMELSASKAFEVYVWQNATAAVVKAVAVYDADSGKFVAKADMPDAQEGDSVKVYINKVTPNYTFTNSGTKLTASAENAPDVTAASITATYETKVKKNTNEDGYDTLPYKYDTKADLATGAIVPNESRVVLTFTNDVTGEITTSLDDKEDSPFYALKITKDGQEFVVSENTKPFVAAEAAYPAGASDIAYDNALKSSSANHVPGAETAKTASSTLAFNATGTYKVEYTVYTRNKNAAGTITYTPQKLTYEFTIATKDLLTASNVRLTAGAADAGVDDPKLVGENDDKVVNKVGIVNGVVQIEVADNWNGENIAVTPTLFAEATDAADFTKSAGEVGLLAGGGVKGTPKAVTGTTKENTLNKENTITIIYNNADYSANDQSITVKWKLVAAKKDVVITNNVATGYTAEQWDARNDNDDDTKAYFKTTVDQIATIEEDLLESITVNNGDPSKLTYEYVEGFGIDKASDELDEHMDGLPTKEGKYSVFFLYEGEIIDTANVQIDAHALFASLTEEQQSYTYGVKAPKTEDLKFVDINGKEVADAGVKNAVIEYYKFPKLDVAQSRKISADGTITFSANTTVDGVNVSAGVYKVIAVGSDNYLNNYTAEAVIINPYAKEYTGHSGYLNAGVYFAVVKSGEDTEIAKEGYALQSDFFPVQVAKKQLTADMITIKPQTYTGGSVAPAVGDMTVLDKDIKDEAGVAVGAIAGCTFAGGTTSASAIGKYAIGVQAPQNSNYTGKVNAQWSIVKPAKNEKMNGLAMDQVKTTIYDNGQIHFEVTRPDDTQFSKGVAQFGVVYDKTGTLAAPTKNAEGKYPRTGQGTADNVNHTIGYADGFPAKAQFAAAAKALQLGNGFGEGKQNPSLVTNKLVYGANVNVVSVDTGCWFRPYVIDGDGDIYYGDVCYVNLVQEATDALQLTMASIDEDNVKAVKTKDEAKKDQSAAVLANKTWRQQVKSGYSQADAKYYVYGSYTMEGNDLVEKSAVQGFGVVVDKKGAFGADGNSTSGEAVTVANGLKLGKGFIEGKAGSNKMDADEYGALITPYNTVTGVWVRAYIDLGKGAATEDNLIVYTDPVYIKDVSSIYNVADITGNKPVTLAAAAADTDANAKTVSNKVTFTTDTLKQRVNVNSNPNLGLGANAVLKQSGVIVDKSGSFLDKPDNGRYIPRFSNAANEAAAKSKMVIGNGYLTGRRAVDAQGAYTATFSQEKYRPTADAAEINIPAVVRPFSVYEIQGKEVVIYGDPIVTLINNLSDYKN